jgi:hypothetical protein
MNVFENMLEEEYDKLFEDDEEILDLLEDTYDEDEWPLIKEDLELTDEDYEAITEALRKRVSSTGVVTKVKSKAVRARRATFTTGMTKTELKMRARKSAKTRKRDVSGAKISIKKRRKALRRRKQMGIK